MNKVQDVLEDDNEDFESLDNNNNNTQNCCYSVTTIDHASIIVDGAA